MSRKPDPLTQYRMRVHEFRGYRYASTQPTVRISWTLISNKQDIEPLYLTQK